MIYHTTTLRILYVSVVYQLDREWCPPSLAMASFVVTLLVRMMHGRVHINEISNMWFVLSLIMIFIEFFYRQHTRRCD
jgi:hypothetical protein